jgi:ComF family protein
MNPWIRVLLHLIFPIVCASCRRTCPPNANGPLCPNCETDWHLRPHSERGPVMSLSVVHSADIFDEQIRCLIHGFKYKGRDDWSRWLALKTWNAVRLNPEAFDCIVPVPMPYTREIVRGFNQSAVLARELSHLSGKPVVENWLKGSLFNFSQTLLGRGQRIKNARSRFKLKSRPKKPYRRVLLVDDVMTTGATLGRCAQILRSSGAQRVEAFVLARDLLKKGNPN